VRRKGDYVREKVTNLKSRLPVVEADARGGADVGPAGGPGRDARGHGLPGTGSAGQLHPGERHPPVAASGGGERRNWTKVLAILAQALEATRFMKKDLLTILDLSREEILALLARARELKALLGQGRNHQGSSWAKPWP
jgi:hypothetical protein